MVRRKKNASPFRVIYLLLIAAVILGLFVIFDRPETEKIIRESVKTKGIFIKNFNEQQVDTLEMSKKDQKVILQKLENNWVVASSRNYKANTANIDQIFKTITTMETDSLASTNKDKQATFEVDEEKGIHVLAKDKQSNPLADFFIGKQGPIATSSYVRRSTENDVYLINQILQDLFDPTELHWKDRTIITLTPNQINELAIIYEGQKVSFKKQDNKWMLTTPEITEADETKVNSLLTTISNFQAADFIDNANLKDLGLAPNKEKVKVYYYTATAQNVYFGQKADDPENYYVRVEGNSMIFKLAKYSVETLKLNIADYKKVAVTEAPTTTPTTTPDPTVTPAPTPAN